VLDIGSTRLEPGQIAQAPL